MILVTLYLYKEIMKDYKIILVLILYDIFYLIAYFIDKSFIVIGLYFITLIIFEIVYNNILRTEERKNIQYQNKLLKQQVDEVENIYMIMRGWKHDYHNHLQSLKGYLKLSQINEIEEYLNILETDLDNIDTLYHSGNVQIDAILNSKLSIAEKYKIKLNVKAEVPAALTVNEIDLCVILGNLLDNAIESCRKIDEIEERFIRVYISVFKKQLYICITNATDESLKIRNDKYFTSKRGDHGHGLKRVDNVVKKYDGYLNRQNEIGVFATEIVLPL